MIVIECMSATPYPFDIFNVNSVLSTYMRGLIVV